MTDKLDLDAIRKEVEEENANDWRTYTSPATLLALLDRLEAAEKERDVLMEAVEENLW